jgi:hypothetical protein
MPNPNRKHLTQLLTCVLVFLYSNIGLAAEVSFWSLESLSSDKKGSFAEIWVRCVGDDTKTYLRKRAGSRNWCVENSPDSCSSDKREASRRICADINPIVVAPPQPEPKKVAIATVKTGYEKVSTDDLKREQALLQKEQAELESRASDLMSRKQTLRQKVEGL